MENKEITSHFIDYDTGEVLGTCTLEKDTGYILVYIEQYFRYIAIPIEPFNFYGFKGYTIKDNNDIFILNGRRCVVFANDLFNVLMG